MFLLGGGGHHITECQFRLGFDASTYYIPTFSSILFDILIFYR